VRSSVARALTSMHSPQWRARYGCEFEALLGDLPPSPATLADVAGSIAASHRSLGTSIGIVALLLAIVFAHSHPGTSRKIAILHRHGSHPAAACVLAYGAHKNPAGGLVLNI
jgi:hypothetical protein